MLGDKGGDICEVRGATAAVDGKYVVVVVVSTADCWRLLCKVGTFFELGRKDVGGRSSRALHKDRKLFRGDLDGGANDCSRSGVGSCRSSFNVARVGDFATRRGDFADRTGDFADGAGADLDGREAAEESSYRGFNDAFRGALRVYSMPLRSVRSRPRSHCKADA